MKRIEKRAELLRNYQYIVKIEKETVTWFCANVYCISSIDSEEDIKRTISRMDLEIKEFVPFITNKK